MTGAQRSNYDLRERICIGSMTALEMAVYQQVPTDEAEAQMLASADLDDMKSKSDFLHSNNILALFKGGIYSYHNEKESSLLFFKQTDDCCCALIIARLNYY